MKLYSDKSEIKITYNRKFGQLQRRLKEEMRKFDLGINVRKNKKRVVEKYSNTWYDKTCMRLAKAIVKNRDKVCQRCGSNKKLHCSHIINDGTDTRMSVDSDNMKILCYACHLEWRHKRPKEALEWFKEKRPGRWEMLEERAKNHDKGSIPITWRESTYIKLLNLRK